MKGWIQVVLPVWNLPDDKALKKLFCLPSGPFDDNDEADASYTEGSDALDDHTLVTKIIVQASNTRNRSIRHLLAPVGTLSTRFWCKASRYERNVLESSSFRPV